MGNLSASLFMRSELTFLKAVCTKMWRN